MTRAHVSQSILIAGQGKTGTTGLYNAIKEALRESGEPFNCQFEPTTPQPLLALGRYDPQAPVLTKIMAERLDDVAVRYQDFDRRLMTVRDPRDVVISRLLFYPLTRGSLRRASPHAIEDFLDALRAKEADPASRSVVGLQELALELGLTRVGFEVVAAEVDNVTALIDRHDFHVVSYEDFVDGRLDDLSEHLGMTITNPAATGSAWLSHIPRSMTHGEWRDWFTPDDAAFFADLFGDYLHRHGYDPTEPPSPSPSIDPATGSEYVERKLAGRREQIASRYAGDVDPARPVPDEELHLLVDMARDGDATAGYRAARALDEGAARADDAPGRALELARQAALRGHVEAMRLTARLLREIPGPAGSRREAELTARFWEREADLGGVEVPAASAGPRSDAEVRRLRHRLRKARAERDALASSTRYRVGSLLAELARGSLAARRRAARQLLGLALRAARRRG